MEMHKENHFKKGFQDKVNFLILKLSSSKQKSRCLGSSQKIRRKKAIIIMGGPSILKNNLNLSLLKKRSDVIFIEPKALTRKFHEFNLKPDFLFATYPEKLRTNTLQYTFLQAIANNYDLTYSKRSIYR